MAWISGNAPSSWSAASGSRIPCNIPCNSTSAATWISTEASSPFRTLAARAPLLQSLLAVRFRWSGGYLLRLTQKSKYAVRALMELALDERDCPLGVAELARRQHIPERFLEQIFGELRRANVIASRRGAHGGYRFAMPTEEISVLDIVEILDGEIRT